MSNNLELEFAQGGAKFTAELFKLLAADAAGKSIAFSPFSIRACLALALAGAKGDTAMEIAHALHFPADDQTAVAQAYEQILTDYKKYDGVLKVAFKVYFKSGCALNTDYAALVKQSYRADLESIEFAQNVEAADRINAWVEEQTLGKITELVPASALSGLTRVLLLNALHFKGMWAQQFSQDATIEDNFWISQEEAVQLPFMQVSAKYGFTRSGELGCNALEIPYMESDLAMLVLLPHKRDGLKAMGEKLTDFNLLKMCQSLEKVKVDLKFPKFKINFAVELSNVLQKLGMRKPFIAGEADLTKMLADGGDEDGFHVSNVMHKVALEVSEEGTEAAASTAVVVSYRSFTPNRSFQADHPFMYFIWNGKDILFAGTFCNA